MQTSWLFTGVVEDLYFFFIIFYSNLLYLYYLRNFIVMRFIHEPMARMIGATPSHVLPLINWFIYLFIKLGIIKNKSS